ncbi:Uridine nucleosidase 1, partial [Ascosphaera acerosa]
ICGNAYVTAMRDALLAEPRHTAWVVATGTYTNVALLFATYPDVAEHVAGVSLMGGAVGGGFTEVPISHLPGHEGRIGNWTEFAEFNVYCDPEAAQSIFSSPVLAPKTVMATLDLTHKVLATPDVLDAVLYADPVTRQHSSDLRQMLFDLLTFFTKTYKDVFGLVDGPPLHDPLAVAVLLSNLNPTLMARPGGPELALTFDDRGGERFHVRAVTDGVHQQDRARVGQLGRTVVTPLEGGAQGCGGVAIPRGVDVPAFWGIVKDCIRRAGACRQASVVQEN